MKYIKAKSISYGAKRSLSSVKATAIHYTGGSNDTALNEANYFAKTNTRAAGAHFFVDRKGVIIKSIPMSRIAWSVGGARYSDYKKTGGAKYYGKYNNSNTVSIELCGIAKKGPTEAQIKATKKLIKYIRKHCPNAKKIIRHFDVNGKACPAPMCGSAKNNAKWDNFKSRID